MDIHSFDRLAKLMPDADQALPDGLVAQGGDLAPRTLLCAYSKGLFPWYHDGLPILWWAPNPRCILLPAQFRLSRTTRRKLRRNPFFLTIDRAFDQVIRACAEPRPDQAGTWITSDMLKAYEKLHALGYAHSVEAWQEGRLVGGLYGVAFGRAFFGESMFHRVAEASRAALCALVGFLKRRNFLLIDCQQETPHMQRMGAAPVPNHEFQRLLGKALSGRDFNNNDQALCPWLGWLGFATYENLLHEWEMAALNQELLPGDSRS